MTDELSESDERSEAVLIKLRDRARPAFGTASATLPLRERDLSIQGTSCEPTLY